MLFFINLGCFLRQKCPRRSQICMVSCHKPYARGNLKMSKNKKQEIEKNKKSESKSSASQFQDRDLNGGLSERCVFHECSGLENREKHEVSDANPHCKPHPVDLMTEDEYKDYIRLKVQEGIESADRGELIPHEEVVKQMEKWITDAKKKTA